LSIRARFNQTLTITAKFLQKNYQRQLEGHQISEMPISLSQAHFRIINKKVRLNKAFIKVS